MLYNFCSVLNDILIEIPELDAFLGGLRAVCERYGVAFELKSHEYGGSLVLVPFSEWDDDLIVNNLDEYDGGIPFLDQAKAEWVRKMADDRLARRRVDEEKARATMMDRETVMKRGVQLSDGFYRLVKDG